MTPVFAARPASITTWASRTPTQAVAGFLLAMVFTLNVPALLGANAGALQTGAGAVTAVSGNAATFPGIWARWDSGYYLEIATTGYQPNGEELAFFPGYPLLLKLLALDQPAAMLWVGYLIAIAAFVTAGVLLWQLVRAEHGAPAAWATVISLAVFPTALFFTALYAESLFLLLGVLTYWFSVRRRYYLAALCVAGAAVTRITGGLFILIPLIEAWQERSANPVPQPDFWPTAVGIVLLSISGVAVYVAYLWLVHGNPLAFLAAHAEFWHRSITWPWQPTLDSALVALVGYGGNEANLYMRLVSLADLLSTLLMLGLTIIGLRWLRPSLAAYQAAAMLFLLMSHGPLSFGLWSMSRIILGLFPGFIVLGRLLTWRPQWRWLKWAAWAMSFASLLFLTAMFGNGRWLA